MIRSTITRCGSSTMRSVAAVANSAQIPKQSLKALPMGARMASSYISLFNKAMGLNSGKKKKPALPQKNSEAFKSPIKIKGTSGVRVCEVTFKSFQLHRIDFYMRFCRKAAQHMNIPCTGVVRFPKMIRRWTVLKSPFVHKSSMEVFERRTYKRLLVIHDTNPEVLRKWLDYIGENIPAGIGMKYNIHEYDSLNVGQEIKRALETHDTTKLSADDLAMAKRVDLTAKRGRRLSWTTYKDIPVYSKDDIKDLAQKVIDELKNNPRSDIEKVTRSIVMATKPPKEEKFKKIKPEESPSENNPTPTSSKESSEVLAADTNAEKTATNKPTTEAPAAEKLSNEKPPATSE